jgi:hypothetical protein
MMPPKDNEQTMIEWLREDAVSREKRAAEATKILFEKMDKLDEKLDSALREWERHSPCVTLRGHVKAHEDSARKWWEVWSKVAVSAALGAAGALAAVWNKIIN